MYNLFGNGTLKTNALDHFQVLLRLSFKASSIPNFFIIMLISSNFNMNEN